MMGIGLSNFFQAGGFIMYPLLGCSFLVWVVFIERLWFFIRFRNQVEHLFAQAYPLLKEKKLDEAKGIGRLVYPIIETPYRTLFDKGPVEEKAFRERLERRCAETRASLGRTLWILGTIGSSAPFVGLFGTVVGIIKSFESIALSGKSGFSVVAAGLSEALIATAAGILVAVVAIVFYNYLRVYLNKIDLEFQHKIKDMEELF